MNHKLIFLIVVLIAAGCQSYQFKDAFAEMKQLDAKYNASFYTEALDVENVFSDVRIYDFDWERTIINPEVVDLYVADLNLVKEKVQNSDTKDKEAIVKFIEGRKLMLESERLYLAGLAIGERGSALDSFSCKDEPYIMNRSDYYNQSSIVGQNATALFDNILTHNPSTREFLTDKNRPKFYDSPFWPIRKFAINNKAAVSQLCK